MKSSVAKETAARLQSILMRDKLKAPEGFSEILNTDLLVLLKNYFELVGGLKIELRILDNLDLSINIEAQAKRIKAFQCVN